MQPTRHCARVAAPSPATRSHPLCRAVGYHLNKSARAGPTQAPQPGIFCCHHSHAVDYFNGVVRAGGHADPKTYAAVGAELVAPPSAVRRRSRQHLYIHTLVARLPVPDITCALSLTVRSASTPIILPIAFATALPPTLQAWLCLALCNGLGKLGTARIPAAAAVGARQKLGYRLYPLVGLTANAFAAMASTMPKNGPSPARTPTESIYHSCHSLSKADARESARPWRAGRRLSALSEIRGRRAASLLHLSCAQPCKITIAIVNPVAAANPKQTEVIKL